MASISKTVRPKRSNNATVSPAGYGLTAQRGTPSVSGSTPTGWLANLPAGLSVVTDYAFNAVIPTASSDQPMGDGSGWNVYYPTAARTTQRIVDTSGGVSPQYAMETLYESGDVSGVGKVKLYIPSISSTVRKFYVCMRIKYDSNYEWNTISNKLFYIEPGNIILQSCHNVGGTQYYGSVYISGTDHLPTNNVTWPLGEYMTVEYYVYRHATAGILQVWVNGVQTLNETNINVPIPSGTQEINLNDTWGGSTSARTRNSYRWMDHIYIATGT